MINRVDFQGAIIRTADFNQKQNEDTKVVTDQSAFQSQVKKDVEERTTTVTETQETQQRQEEKHDAKEKGKNEYTGDGGRQRRQQEASKSPEEMERLSHNVIDKNGHRVDLQISKGFDFKI